MVRWMSAAHFIPMEARLVHELPNRGGWQFEPKWDGFRCLVTLVPEKATDAKLSSLAESEINLDAEARDVKPSKRKAGARH